MIELSIFQASPLDGLKNASTSPSSVERPTVSSVFNFVRTQSKPERVWFNPQRVEDVSRRPLSQGNRTGPRVCERFGYASQHAVGKLTRVCCVVRRTRARVRALFTTRPASSVPVRNPHRPSLWAIQKRKSWEITSSGYTSRRTSFQLHGTGLCFQTEVTRFDAKPPLPIV